MVLREHIFYAVREREWGTLWDSALILCFNIQRKALRAASVSRYITGLIVALGRRRVLQKGHTCIDGATQGWRKEMAPHNITRTSGETARPKASKGGRCYRRLSQA